MKPFSSTMDVPYSSSSNKWFCLILVMMLMNWQCDAIQAIPRDQCHCKRQLSVGGGRVRLTKTPKQCEQCEIGNTNISFFYYSRCKENLCRDSKKYIHGTNACKAALFLCLIIHRGQKTALIFFLDLAIHLLSAEHKTPPLTLILIHFLRKH